MSEINLGPFGGLDEVMQFAYDELDLQRQHAVEDVNIEKYDSALRLVHHVYQAADEGDLTVDEFEDFLGGHHE